MVSRRDLDEDLTKALKVLAKIKLLNKRETEELMKMPTEEIVEGSS